MPSQLIIRFNSNPLTGSISLNNNVNTAGIFLNFAGDIQGATTDETIFNSSQRISSKFNNTDLYAITPDYINDELILDALIDEIQFSINSNSTLGAVDLIINNVPPPPDFTLDSVTTAQSASDVCNNVEVTITTNIQATDIITPISNPVASNPYVVDIPRSINVLPFQMRESNLSLDSNIIELFVPPLVSADFSTDVINSPGGGTVTVNNNYVIDPAFTLEYSLDNISWYLGNSFTALPLGSYTVYVRDNLGCSFSLPFDIDEFTPEVTQRSEFYSISNLNSFRFKKCEDFAANIKTPFNTLSFEENVQDVEKGYRQPFEIGDGIIVTQFKSSYETNEAFLIDSDGVETPLTVTQQTQNLDIQDVRDGSVYSVDYQGLPYVGVQFGSGNTYDPVTLLPNGTYSLGNSLPAWFDIGDYLNIQNAGWIRIIDIIPVNGVNTAIMNQLASSYPETLSETVPLLRQITSYYNNLEYEVFEFPVDLSSLSGCYQIRIDLSDGDFEDISWMSEIIDVQESHDNTHLVQWYNTVNNEIVWSTGIRGKARFHYFWNAGWSPNSEQEVFLADTNTVQVESTVREFYSYNLSPIPTAMAQKFILIVANDRLFIDDINLIKESESEFIRLGGRNLYQITQQLIRSNYVFDSISQDGNIIVNDGTPLAIEGLGNGLLYIE